MNKETMTKFVKGVQTSVSKNSPKILMGIGIAGMITGTVLAVKATPKALRLLEDAQYEKGETLTPVEKVQTAWKPYIPAATTIAVSTACLIGSNTVSSRRTAAIATAYKLSETALSEYRDAVVETIGEKKEKDIRSAVAKKKIEEKPTVQSAIFVTGKGNTRFRDGAFGTTFVSDIDTINRVINDLNRRMLSEMYISLNEFYGDLNLEPVEMGDELGWNIDTGFIEVEFDPQLDKDNTPIIVMSYRVAPKYDFSKLM